VVLLEAAWYLKVRQEFGSARGRQTGLLGSGHSLCISERPLPGKLLVGTVPIPASRISPNWPVSQILILRLGMLRTGHWRPQPTGHEGTLGNSLHSRRSTQGPLHTGHSIGVISYSRQNFGCAATAATDYDWMHFRTRPGGPRSCDKSPITNGRSVADSGHVTASSPRNPFPDRWYWSLPR
jgi:hypothetical protein